MKLIGQSTSLAPRRMWVRLRPSPPRASVVSTASTRPLYGRGAGSTPAGGSFRTPVAQWTERCPATAEDAGSTPAGRTRRGRSSDGRAPERHSGEARSIRVVRFAQACGVTEARRAPTSLVRVRILAGLPADDRRGPERLGYLMARAAVRVARAVRRPRRPTAPHDRDVLPCCGPDGVRLSTPNRQVAGSNPARAYHAPVAQWQSSSAVTTTTAAASIDRGPKRTVTAHPRSIGRSRPPPGDRRVATRSAHHDRGRAPTAPDRDGYR